MKILIACEESQEVCKAFREQGHEAYSCDIEPCSGGHPEWHIQDDIVHILHTAWQYDMLIAFPPCTHLAVSGARHFEKKKKDGRQQEAIDFFMMLVGAPFDKIAIENPIGIMSTKYRKPDQIIQPFEYGHKVTKSTCLWLKGLPLLKPTKIVGKGEFTVFKSGKRMHSWYNKGGKDRSKLRSKTFPGIAKAMAEQWSDETYIRVQTKLDI